MSTSPSPGLLNQALLEKAIGEPIESYKTSPGSTPGDNVIGSLLSIAVTSKSGKKFNLIYKNIEPDSEQSQFAIMCALFWLENGLYKHVIPQLQSLVKETVWDPPTAKYYLSMNDDKMDYLIIDDLRPHGYTMEDKFRTYDFSQVSMVMKKIAQFHAMTHYLLVYKGEKVFEEPGMKIYLNNMWNSPNPMMEGFGAMLEANIVHSITVLKERNPEIAKALEQFFNLHKGERMKELLKTIRCKTDVKHFPCLVHGDLWMNNILLKYDENKVISDAKFIDFQMTRRGNIFEDLVYFFYCSTTPEFRKDHLAQCLMVYYEAFVSHLEKIGCPPVPNFTRGFFIDSFYENMLAGHVFMYFAIPLQLGVPIEVLKEKLNGDANAPAGNFDKTLVRLQHSPKAVDRLESLVKEAIEMKLF